MKLSYCPQLKVVHTSRQFHGQLFVPFLNWLLLLGTVLVTAVYNNTTSLGHAYGVCVIFVTFFDTLMVTLVAILVWRFPIWIVVFPALFFATLDGLYLSSALNKVPDGAWFTLLVAGLLAGMFLLWRFGKENQWRAEAEDRFPPSSFVTKDGEEDRLRLTSRWGGDRLSPVSGLAIFFDKTGVLTPSVFTHFVSKIGALPDVSIFFHLHPVETPSVPDEERFHVSRFTSISGCYRLVARHGFMDEVVSPDLGALIYQEIRRFVVRQAAAKSAASEQDTTAASASTEDTNTPPELSDEKIAAELARLDRAYAHKVLYIVGKGQMKIRIGTSIFRRFILGTFLWIRDNSRAKIANLRLSMERVVEVGFVKEV